MFSFASRDLVTPNRFVCCGRCLQKRNAKDRVLFQMRRRHRNGKLTSKVLKEEWAAALAASDKGSYFEKSPHFINEHVITFHIVYFALFLKTKISSNEADIWQECCLILWQKKLCRGILLFFASSKVISI